MTLPINTFLQGGKYKITRFINSGGFGCTYQAQHVMLEKQVAIKEFFVKDFCNRDETTSHVKVGALSKKELVEKLRRKFIEEAKGLCRLQHPGIVHVSDVFEENGTAYFVMDYIEGRSLNDIVKNVGPLPEYKVLKYIRQVAEALQYVHDHNRLHLDVKPANIMINAKDDVVLIDFGASKQYDEQDGENTSTLLGKTPGYAPLEQIGNDVVKFMPATDIYSLGATLYKLLTGKTPLSANILASGETLDPLPHHVSASTAKAIASAMEINKNKRPQTVKAFLAILETKEVPVDDITVVDVTPTIKQPAPPVSPRRKRPMGILAAIASGVLFAIFLIYISMPKSPERIPEVIEVEYDNPQWGKFVYSGPVTPQGFPEGTGKGIYVAGTYNGEYKNGLRQGKGTYETTDRSNRFEGSFVNDYYHEGRLTIKDGSYFVGTFKENKFFSGKWYDKNGTFDSEMREGVYL